MCGRFTLATSSDEIADLFDVSDLPEIKPRYNIAPTQDVPVCRVDDDRRGVAELHWGLVPFWADEKKIGNRMINARGETVANKPAFRAAFKYRRCLIPADGFYEWKKEQGGKQPYRIRRKDDAPFAFAGLWEQWSDEDNEKLESFTIITCDAADWISDLHGRMPVILERDHFDFWLDTENEDYDALEDLLVPYDRADLMTYEPVSRDVNSPSNDRAELIEPLEE
jgi:putative SOS response-associated peptidase YedK